MTPSANGRCDGPRFVRDYLPVLAMLAATFVASSIPGTSLPPLAAWNADKVVHTFEYALLGFLVARPISRARWGARAWVVILVTAVIASAWGGSDEVHQLFTPNRSCDWRDWIADTSGGLLGACLQQVVARVRGARARSDAPDASHEAAP